MTASPRVVIANATAGSNDRETLERALRVLVHQARVQVRATGDAAAVDAAVAEAAGGTAVVAGGDGSLHVAVRSAYRQGLLDDVAFALLPLGTGNDFARGLGVPLDASAAAESLPAASLRRLDLLLTDDGDVVVNASHAGLGAAAAQRSAGMKDTLGPLAYPLGALVAGVRESGYRLTVRADGEVVHDGATLLVAIANGPFVGGGTRLAPPAQPDDGYLDLVVVSAVGGAARLAFGAALRSAAHLDRPDVLHRRARAVAISGEAVQHDLDGEVRPETTQRAYEVQPGAWRFLAPTSAASAEPRRGGSPRR